MPKSWILGLSLALTILFSAATGASGADSSDPLDQRPEPLTPKVPRTEAETDRVQAEALFAAGRMLEQRDDIAGALRRYQRAARYDPEGVPILRSVVDMAVRLRRNAEATRYALRYAELDASNAALMHGLARILTAEDNSAQAIALYDRALKANASLHTSETAEMLLELGRLQYLTKDYPAAAQTLSKLSEALEHPEKFKLSPTTHKELLADGATYELMAESYLEADRPDDAAKIFAKIDAGAPNVTLSLWHAARIALRRKQYDEALAALDKFFATKNTDQGTVPYTMLADVLKSLGKSDELIPRLTKLHEADPDNALLTFALADRCRQEEKYDLARPLYWQLVDAKPVVEVFQGVIEVEQQTKQTAAVLKALGKAASAFNVALVSGLDETTKKLTADAAAFKVLQEVARQDGDKLDPQTALALGALACDAKQFDVASEFFEIGLKPAQSAAVIAWLRYWGVELFTAEKFEQAAAVFQRGIEAKPPLKEHTDLLYLLASSLAMQDKSDAALSSARKAAALDAKSVRLRSRIAWIQYHAKRNDDAYKSYRDLIDRFDRRDAEEDRDYLREARLVLSTLAVLRGDMPEAEEWLEQVLDEFPDDVGASNDLGYLWADQNKRLGRSLEMIRRAVNAEPENQAYRDSLGWVYYRLGRFADAEPEMLKAAASEKPDGAVLDHLGDVLVKLNKSQQAADAYRRACDALEKENDATKLATVKQKLAELKP